MRLILIKDNLGRGCLIQFQAGPILPLATFRVMLKNATANDYHLSPTPCRLHSVVVFSEETGITIIAALNHMARNTGEVHTGFSGHSKVLLQWLIEIIASRDNPLTLHQ